jgi:hypothetical protein
VQFLEKKNVLLGILLLKLEPTTQQILSITEWVKMILQSLEESILGLDMMCY